MDDWQPIGTAPKDGTPIRLYYANPSREIVGAWWSRDRVLSAVGKKKAASGRRGELIAQHGGYWGSAGKRSTPADGWPTHWIALTDG